MALRICWPSYAVATFGCRVRFELENVVLETFARIAGIGGVAVGVLLILFREVLRRTVFSKISPDHSFQLLRLVVVFTGIVAIGGLATWAVAARRNNDSEAAGSASRLTAIRAPIDNMFKAWETKDLTTYLAQWHPNGRQWVGQTPRSVSEIAERRRKDFSRYRTVNVIDYKVDIENTATEPVTARVLYTMRFQRPDGSWISETDMRETYKLVFSTELNRWVISENYDYFVQ